ncbi:MAG: 2-aminoethylphosphonate--pyruvate transaminase [Elusimicrobiota bacterium]|jgi:2-aminoethylphosphonate-pyruvate transaminase|nr:2-aminoethylphosphonate--pyruvate transaminase [Elusimicrobiota bacterium]
MQAVILAAGLGSRLEDKTKYMPKGFIELNGIAIVEWSVQKLINAGIDKIIIGTGHCSNFYDDLAKKYSVIRTIKNYDYANVGSMATLDICVDLIDDDFLLLESDLIYDKAGLNVLINDRRSNIVLASGATCSGDEVYIEIGKNDLLKNISKKKDELANAGAELVGISKVSLKLLKSMRLFFDKNKKDFPKLDYEKVLASVSTGDCPVFVKKIQYYAWREIDDNNHLEMAKKEILPRIIENESLYSVEREVLLNPGPATTTDSVKYAQICPDICPREKKFGGIMRWICDELSAMVGKKENIKTVLFGGSGTAADEAMISSCIPDDGKLLIVNNGAYGLRLAKIAEVYKINFEIYESSGFLPIDIETLKSKLIDGKFTHIAIVYHETTTGLLNPVPEICRFCREYGIVTIVDAVSAFAAIPIDMDRDCIDFMASTSNKNIQAMAGAAFVFCRKQALENIKNYPMRNYYLNLWSQYLHFEKSKQMRFTPPVQTLYALRQAIIETKIETIEKRYARYSACWKELVKTVDELKLKMLVPLKHQSKMITAVLEPKSPKYNFDDFHDFAQKSGFTIYPGKISQADTFRIANIGDIKVWEMQEFCRILKKYMEEI